MLRLFHYLMHRFARWDVHLVSEEKMHEYDIRLNHNDKRTQELVARAKLLGIQSTPRGSLYD